MSEPMVRVNGGDRREVNLLEAIRALWRVDLELPLRELAREPPTFDPPS